MRRWLILGLVALVALVAVVVTIYLWPGAGPVDDPIGSDMFCPVPLPSTWRAALAAGAIHQDGDDRINVVAAADDGRSIFVDVRHDGTRDVEWRHDGQRTTMLSLPDIAQGVDSATFDGRWLSIVLNDGNSDHSGTALRAGLYAWDSQSAAPARYITPLFHVGPRIADAGRVFFTAYGVDTPGAVEMLDLASGDMSSIGQRVVGDPARYGSLVVWPVTSATMSRPGDVWVEAADIATGQPADAPRELTGYLRRDTIFAGDGPTLVGMAGSDEDQHDDTHRGQSTTFAWHAGDGTRITLANWSQGVHDWRSLQVGGPWVGYGTDQGRYIFDLRSHSYTQISTQPGDFILSADALVLRSGFAEEAGPAILDETMIRPGQLPPLPTCSTG